MLTFKRSEIKTNGTTTKGYAVDGLDDKVFRGLQVAVVKNSYGWHAYEATTGLTLTPPSWAGSFSNKTRDGILQIVSNYLSRLPDLAWEQMQAKLDYTLNS